VVVVEGVTVTSVVTEVTTMLVIGLIFSMFGIGLFCWVIFTLAVYALPFFVGLTAGMAAFDGGAGVIGALLVGIVTGAVTLAIGQIAFALVRPPILRAAIAAAFAIPAAIAGYHAVRGVSQIGLPSLIWREVFASIGALFIGGTAWVRMTVFADPLPLRPGATSQDGLQQVLTAARHEG
jgi:intracellular septation protein A